jgi:hypothetical protein
MLPLVRTDGELPSHAHSVSVHVLSKLPVATIQRRAANLFRGSRIHFSSQNEAYYGRTAKYCVKIFVACVHHIYGKGGKPATTRSVYERRGIHYDGSAPI